MMNVVATRAAPEAIGPYVQAITAEGSLYSYGQTPMTPAGVMVDGRIPAQAEPVFGNLAAELDAAGASRAHAANRTVSGPAPGHVAHLNAVYERRFAGHKPARSTVQVAGLPRGVLVEIDAVATASYI